MICDLIAGEVELLIWFCAAAGLCILQPRSVKFAHSSVTEKVRKQPITIQSQDGFTTKKAIQRPVTSEGQAQETPMEADFNLRSRMSEAFRQAAQSGQREQ